MSKKLKRLWPKGWLINPQQVEMWIDKCQRQTIEEDFRGAIVTAKRILRYVPKQARERGDALHQIGIAYAMLNMFDKSYDALTKALTVIPDDPALRYNRGLSSI